MIMISSFPAAFGDRRPLMASIICDVCDGNEFPVRVDAYGASGPAPVAETVAKQAGWVLIRDAKGGQFKGHACPSCAGCIL